MANGFEWAHEQDEDSDGKLDFCLLPCDKSFLEFMLQVDSSGLGSTRRSRGKWTRVDSFGLAVYRRSIGNLDSPRLALKILKVSTGGAGPAKPNIVLGPRVLKGML